MTDEHAKPGKQIRRQDLVMRIVLIAILVVVVIMGIGNFKMRWEYKKALALYEEGTEVQSRDVRSAKVQEAHDIFEALIRKPLSIIKVRGMARKALAQCKMQLAVDIGQNERSSEGYTKAVAILEQAKELDPSSIEIETRLREYRMYKKQRERSTQTPVELTLPEARSSE